MESNDQLGLDFDVEQTAWGRWVDPDRRAAQVRKFLDHAGLEDIPPEPWPEGAPDVKRLDSLLAELFPDMSTAMASENADIVDAFICFLGECFIRFAGARWIEYDWFGREYSFYDEVNPALLFDTADEDEMTAWYLMDSMIGYDPEDHDGMFSKMAAAIREYAGYRDEEQRDGGSSIA